MRSSDDRDQARLLTTGRSSEARERLAGSLQRAFPLPKSGQFTDLLDALAGVGWSSAEGGEDSQADLPSVSGVT